MSTSFYTRNNKRIVIEDKPLATGGEGTVHKVVSPFYSGHCVKMYHDKSKMGDKQRKIEFMIANPPVDLKGVNYNIVCWPKEIIFSKNKEFVGFIMPLAFPNSKELYELCSLNNKLPSAWQQKYDRRTGRGLIARMKLCTNLAASVHRVHSLRKYVFADMKPQNILVTNDSKVSLVDLDSIQISENKKILFPASVATGEYEPPESKIIKSRSNLALEESWDRFSMAIIFYEILFGIHPYAASFSGHYQSCHETSESIQNNLFVHGANKKYVRRLPPLHENYHKIPTSLQELFTRAFDRNPVQRPTAEEFGEVFYTIVIEAEKKTSNHSSFSSTRNTPKYAKVKCRILACIVDVVVFVLFINLVKYVLQGMNAFSPSVLEIMTILIYFYYTVYTLRSSPKLTPHYAKLHAPIGRVKFNP